MFLTRALRAKPISVVDRITNWSSQKVDRTKFEEYRKGRATEILEKLKEDFKNQQVNHDFWDKFRSNPALHSLQFSRTNFENKFLDLIYDSKLDNKEILESLKSYFEHRNIDKSLVLKCSYGQLLLMLKDAKYDEEIERIYTSLHEEGILGEQVCTNFLLAYSKSSKERFLRCFDYLNRQDFKNIRLEKKGEFMDLAMEYKEKEKFIDMLRLLEHHEKCLLNKFNERCDEFEDEESFIKLVIAINERGCLMQTRNVNYICNRMRAFNYDVHFIQPTTPNCPRCNELMPQLPQDEAEELKAYFVEKFLEQTKIMRSHKLKSMINGYLEYLKNQENHFDLIIDGLNLSFQGKVNFQLVKTEKKGGVELKTSRDHLESNIISQLTPIVTNGSYKNILLIGRFGQANYESFMEFTQKHNITCRFFIKEVDDDLSVILAGLFNKDAKIATNDYFSDYCYKMKDDKIERLFKRFLGTRIVTFMRKNLSVNYFNEGWLKCAHHNPKTQTIHIPFDTDNEVYRHLYRWYCFSKKT